MKMGADRWPTSYYLLRILLIYSMVALAAGCGFMAFAIVIVRPETLFAVVFGIVLGFFLYYTISRRGSGLVSRITHLFFS